MIKKFSFWMVLILLASLGSMVFIHWRSLQDLHQKTAKVQPLFRRQKIIDSMVLSLERYRRLSASFRKLEPEEMSTIKGKLKSSIAEGVNQLDALDPTDEEKSKAHQLNDQMQNFLGAVANAEPSLFSKDGYQKPEVVSVHDEMMANLALLEKSAQKRISGLSFDSSHADSKSILMLTAVGGGVFLLLMIWLLRNYFVFHRPMSKLRAYAGDLKNGKPIPDPVPHFSGTFGELQNVLNQLAHGVETHVRDRHKFILDIVSDLKTPLSLLQSGKVLLNDTGPSSNEEKQILAADSVRRGLAIFAGSLEDLNDIVDINRLESRMEEKTVDLADLLSDVARTLTGTEAGRRISLSVPPMPVWVSLDARRMERLLIQVITKVASTLAEGSSLTLSLAQVNTGQFRGVEIVIQDSDRARAGRGGMGGPEQDILKHWVSETGLSMALAYKVMKIHGGTISAAGVAGTSVTVTLRLPQERVMSRGLISPPTPPPAPAALKGQLKPEVGNQSSVV